VRAALDEPPAVRLTRFLPPREEAPGEELSEERADAHAGEKVPAATDLTGFPGIVAEGRFIERRRHEFGEREGAFAGDPVSQQGA